MLIAANLNPKVIQARLGHATITETTDSYGHLFPDAEDLGRGAIAATFTAGNFFVAASRPVCHAFGTPKIRRNTESCGVG
jgi:hypothetical protein